MPSPADFKKAFGFETGSEVCPQVIIERAHIGHEVIQKNEKYEFPSTLDLSFPTKSVSRCDLLTTLRGYAGKRPKIIYSSYGSPYACQVHGWKIISFLNEAGTAHARFLGKAVRRRDIPTLAQQSSMQRDRKRKKAGPSPSPNEIDEMLADTMRVIKSRFGTSRCHLCHEAIQPGVLIAKSKHASGRGEWVHAECALTMEKERREKQQRT